ncbi:MAG TPA: 23S rRNA (guanosine(2251)-2'-O)-methyltransferase RlmB [Candidatus Paceibacterota bacterium]|nr:23S rRNA (guanosine(2251)-2'-O)-methyltransferase RlmB [Candidatus Paceibacterota bacterium]
MRPKSHLSQKPHSSEKREKVYIYGRHALMEALRSAPHVVRKVFLEPGSRDKELKDLLAKHQVPTAEMAPGRGKELAGRDAVHQGVIATIDPGKLLIPFDDFIASLDLSKKPAVAVLGEVQDPHNVGAIIRSAAAFGFSGVLIPEHRQAPVTGAVVKSSAGMAFRIPLVSIGNVNHALEVLKKKGFWTYGLAMEGSQTVGADAFDAPSAFVVGNEGAGIRQMTLEKCDVKLSIPMHARTESLNAAVAAAVVFYEWSRKHPEAL